MHRDAIDPSRSPLHAVWHWLSESASGRVFVAAGVGALVGATVAALVDDDE